MPTAVGENSLVLDQYGIDLLVGLHRRVVVLAHGGAMEKGAGVNLLGRATPQ